MLDNSLLPPKRQADADAGIGGELWAVHGGGFYHAQKFRVAPAELPEPLHWFKWEAYSTWMSGFALFVVMYYAHARRLPDRPQRRRPRAVAGGRDLASRCSSRGWIFYDQLCKRARPRPRAARSRSSMIAFVALVAWGLSHVFAGRAMYIQVGAMIGTIMAGNVFFVIIPSQRKLVEAKERDVAPDPVYGLRGKQRSVHNNYFTLPVLFIMISNHYPMTCGHPHAWLVLVAILLLAAFVRHFFNLRHKGRTVWAIPATAALATLALAIAIAPAKPAGRAAPHVRRRAGDRRRALRDVPRRRSRRSRASTTAPKGVLLDTPERIVAQRAEDRRAGGGHARRCRSAT